METMHEPKGALVGYVPVAPRQGRARLALVRYERGGATTQFALVWDGYDLVRTLSRVVSII